MAEFNPRIIEKVDLTVVGQRGNEQNASIISERVSVMLHLEDKIKNVANRALCQIIWAKDRESTYDIFAGYEVVLPSDLPEKTQVYQVNSEKIAKFKHTGDTKSLTDFIKQIHSDWFPDSGYCLDDTDFTHIQFVSQIEETDHFLSSENRVFYWEIWVPVKLSKVKRAS